MNLKLYFLLSLGWMNLMMNKTKIRNMTSPVLSLITLSDRQLLLFSRVFDALPISPYIWISEEESSPATNRIWCNNFYQSGLKAYFLGGQRY